MELVAFSGYARSGKDEAAKALVAQGWTRIAFADKLREVLYELNPIVSWSGTPVNKVWYVQDVIDTYGWGSYKETDFGPEIRRLLQRLGTEAGRKTLWDSIWVDVALDNLGDGKYVVTDARFLNEANAVKERGGKIYRIVRAGVGPANDHPSETSLDDYTFDGYIYNNSTIEDFHASVVEKVVGSN